MRQADGSKGEKLWHNVRGRRTLTRYGRENLQDWYDLTIHVPCWEQELQNPHHVHNAVPRQTWYPVSEQSLPGLTRMIANQRFDVQNATMLPVAVKGWILTRLAGPTTDARGHRVLDVGSDREWYYDPTREWRMSVQHVEGNRLRTDLDRPMRGQTFIFNDIPYHWHLSPLALAESDCVPLSLAYSLSEDMESVKKGLTRIAQELGEDPSVGYTRKVVIRYLEEHGELLGKTVGYKVFAGSALVSAFLPWDAAYDAQDASGDEGAGASAGEVGFDDGSFDSAFGADLGGFDF